jgi:hypothetical protein
LATRLWVRLVLDDDVSVLSYDDQLRVLGEVAVRIEKQRDRWGGPVARSHLVSRRGHRLTGTLERVSFGVASCPRNASLRSSEATRSVSAVTPKPMTTSRIAPGSNGTWK